jgi:hypothetical protein
MLGLPLATEVNRRVAKEKIYANAIVNTPLRDIIKDRIEAAGTFYNTAWVPADDLNLRFDGLNMDIVYQNLARQIASGRLGTSGGIAEAVNRDKQRRRLEREIAALEKKMLREKQFNRQVELNGELKRLRGELHLRNF